MTIIKKDGTREAFDIGKVLSAVNKSAERVLYTFSDEEKDFICRFVTEKCESLGVEGIRIDQMHNIVEGALDAISPSVAKSYRDYRNYKTDFVQMLDTVYKKSQSIMYIGDKENSNADSARVSTRRSLSSTSSTSSCIKSSSSTSRSCRHSATAISTSTTCPRAVTR